MTDQSNANWHLDKKVPLAMIGAIILQTCSAFWWASNINTRVSSIEAINTENNKLPVRMSVLEVQVGALAQTGERIEKKIDALIERDR